MGEKEIEQKNAEKKAGYVIAICTRTNVYDGMFVPSALDLGKEIFFVCEHLAARCNNNFNVPL